MRLSPLLVTVVAVAAPFGGSLNANAQTPSNSQQKEEVLLNNQKHEFVEVSRVTAVTSPEVLELSSTIPKTTKDVVIPTSTAKDVVISTPTAQNPPSNRVPEIPPATNQQIPQPSPTPNQQSPIEEPVTQPQNPTTPPNTVPDIPPPDNQQIPQAPAPNQQSPIPETQQQTPNLPPQDQPTQPENTQPTEPTQPENTQPNESQSADETRVLVSEVSIRAETGQLSPELENEIYRVIRTQAGRTTTRTQLQEDINAIFATGFFSNVQALPEDTPLGVRIGFVVRPNPVLTKVQVQANPGTNIQSVLPPNAVDEIFKPQYGRILNLRELQESIKKLTKRYQDQGFVLANVVGAPQVSENGVVTLQVVEGVVENVRIRYRNKEGQETDEKGKPIRGRTQPYIITREIQLKPGQVFNRNTVQRDLQRVFGLGLFEDVNVSLDPGTDPTKVDVIVNVVERNTGSIGAGAGISSASGLFGSISYQEQNLNGRNQKLGGDVQIGVRDQLFDFRFTDPWIAGDPYRTSYTANIFRRRSISLIFDGDDDFNVETFNQGDPSEEGDRPRIVRLGGGITFSRPLSRNVFENAEWTASAGLQYQRVSVQDSEGDVRRFGRVRLEDNCNDPVIRRERCVDLSASGEGRDDLLFLQLGAARDRRNNPLQPTSGSVLRLGIDQSVPVGLGSIFLTRLRGSYSQYFPVRFTNFSRGPQALAFNIQAGTIIGDLPPYEAFSLGGSNSVRGYDEGQLGTGRSFVQASVEYRFPVFSVVSGALFFDVGSDLGTGTRVSEVLNKNGTGFGYGLGVRVQSPLGPIRIDYGITDDGDSRINFGIGERF
ncbi:BamA/TamA family outer membrane protein [Iningainema tapete]|uniref:BamA/TamA family outer membrane protein n=1 Tax=Iningainema tapete BLCC-T55 TaxID=2748662 RepID=A0A8J7C022_9CYAN|nr:BamA/TamA family outer membrane protein [Iningainema tapete]MBD2778952.1 BamA/TamA family outer membrane protein [Iningainema tapete BLCC-T55]